jgi:hypothetical protein
MSAINALARAHLDDQSIIGIFEAHPQGIGQKYSEKGNTREKGLLQQVQDVREQDEASRKGGAPTMADLRMCLDMAIDPGQSFTNETVSKGLGANS